jgi:hypothetical protein
MVVSSALRAALFELMRKVYCKFVIILRIYLRRVMNLKIVLLGLVFLTLFEGALLSHEKIWTEGIPLAIG